MLLQWLRLFRIAGLSTLLSNMVAVIACTGLSSWDLLREMGQNAPAVGWVLASSFFIYGAGMIWNDLADCERDVLIAPRRPLPSGRISYVNAWTAGIVCAVLGLLCAAQLGWRGFHSACIVLTLALLYDCGVKSLPWLGSLLMAATRASHACFALLLLGPEHFDAVVLGLLGLFRSDLVGQGAQLAYYPLVLALYIFAITLISELEHRRSYRWELVVATSALALAFLVVTAHNLLRPDLHDLLIESQITGAGLRLIMLFGLLAWALYRLGKVLLPAIRLASRQLIGPFMVRGLSGIIIFDALVVAGYRPELAPLILLLLVPFTVLGRLARMD